MRHAMTDKHDKEPEEDIVVDAEFNPGDEPNLEEQEEYSSDKLKVLRDKLKSCEKEKMSHLEELQRMKADFLNAKSRLQQERESDKKRFAIAHVEKLLPLCDSFFMAMADKEAWAEAPEKWRKGVEGINAQLHSLLLSYKVNPVSPEGEQFDPSKHEALTNVPVSKKSDHNKVVSVIQQGFEMTNGDSTTIVRPARVTVGEFSETADDKE